MSKDAKHYEPSIEKLLDIPFKDFMPGQIIQSSQFNDDMLDIEDKVNEIITKHNGVDIRLSEHQRNLLNPHCVTATQINAYEIEEVDELINDVKNGNLNDEAITNRVLADACVDNRVLVDGAVTLSKLDTNIGNQIDISNNMSIKERYTKLETDAIIQEKVGDGTYSKEQIDAKFEEYQAGTIVDGTLDVTKLKGDVGRKLDITHNPSISNRYTKSEVNTLIAKNGLPKDWGNLSDEVDDEIVTQNGLGSLPISDVMMCGEFKATETDVLNIKVQDVEFAKGEFNTLEERLDNVDTQLAHIVEYNAVEQGCDNKGIKDCSDILNNLIKSNTTIFFPKGKYLIGKRIVKDLIENVKLYSNGDAVLMDGGTQVVLEDNSSATCPNGILFKNFDDLTIEGVNFGNNNTVEKGVGKRIKESEEEKRFPVIAFENGKDLKLKNIKTFNTVGSTVASQLNNSIDTYLNAFYIKIKNVKGGEISNIRFDKSTNAGEPLGVYNCECLTINNIKYFQDEEVYYIWSILKLINSCNVSVNSITVSSVSNTSLIDVCGKNISINNIKADYPNGKIIDVTLEWGNYNVDSDNIEIKNITTNGLVLGSTFDGLEKKMNNIIFENIITNQDIARKRLLINSKNLKSYVIKDSSFTNISDVNTNFIDESLFIEKNNALITNCDFICNQDIYNNTMSFETLGLLKIYNCNIEANGNKISYFDRIGNVFNSDNSIYGEIIIESTTFRNAEILLSSNIKFVNCSFIDCWFTSTSNTAKRNFEINFNNCLFLYNSKTIENPFYLIGSGKKYNFTNCKFAGVIIKQADYLFYELTNYTSPINFIGCEFNVYLNNTTALTVVKSSLRSFVSPINFINCIFTGKNKVVYFDLDNGSLASSVTKFNVIGCFIERNDAFQSNGTLTTGSTNTKIRLGVVGNSLQSTTLTKIEALKGLNKIQQNGNVEL